MTGPQGGRRHGNCVISARRFRRAVRCILGQMHPLRQTAGGLQKELLRKQCFLRSIARGKSQPTESLHCRHRQGNEDNNG